MAAVRPEPERDPGAAANDRELVRAALSGDERAVEAVLARLACVVKFVFQLNRSLGYRLSTDSLEDVVQQVYASLWPRLRDFHGGASLESWAYGFCRNCLRAEARRRRGGPLRLIPGGDNAAAGLPPQPATDLAGPDEVAEQAERADALRAALADLPPEEREVVELRHLEDWSFERIARHHGLAASTVKDRCYRGMQRLQRWLRESDVAGGETTARAEVSGA